MIDLEITHPGENARIIHVLDTIAPMVKVEGEGIQYSGFFSTPYTVGRGVTNMLCGFAVMESAALPWDESNASSGLLYPRVSSARWVAIWMAISRMSLSYSMEDLPSFRSYTITRLWVLEKGV